MLSFSLKIIVVLLTQIMQAFSGGSRMVLSQSKIQILF